MLSTQLNKKLLAEIDKISAIYLNDKIKAQAMFDELLTKFKLSRAEVSMVKTEIIDRAARLAALQIGG